ncbi:MAG: NAD(P)-binding domain-containing protein, partial [Coriobacteriia bacterium]|nr:NAD(P)-binding domain-containing protein [Coriobacteriia bacterium]
MTGPVEISGRMLVVGGGRMGEAIIGGLVRSAALSSEQIVVAEPSSRRRDELCAAYPGLKC